MGPVKSGSVKVRVFQNDVLTKTVVVDQEKMYTVWEGSEQGGLLKLEFEAPVQVYALTFG
jgi:hypothetical protein